MNTNKKTIITLDIDWKPDKNSTIPLYLQIVEYICSKVSNGHWLVGYYLPSQRTLSKLFNVNRSTIVTAMDELTALGIIEGSFGGGTKIVSNTWSLLMSQQNLDWNNYVKYGSFKSNISTIQTINKLEFENYIRLGTGELSPTLFPKDMMKQVLSKVSNNIISLNYLEPNGLLELRIALSKRLKNIGINTSPNSILITSGSLQALQLISICMLKKGATIFTEAPSYLKSLQVFQSAGMNLTGIPLDNEGISYWFIKNKLNPTNNNLLYTIPTFQNPTGILMSEKRKKDLFEFCQKYRVPVIEDTAYSELWIDDKPSPSLKSMDVNGMILYLGTVSKTLAPGLRLGWIVGPESVINRLADVKMQIDYGASSISQLILTEIFESGLYDKYLITLRKELKIRRANALNALKEYFSNIATWTHPTGGFYIWVTLNSKISIDKLFKEALKHNILLNPGSIYDFTPNNSFRLSYSYEDCDTFKKAIFTLSELIKTSLNKKN